MSELYMPVGIESIEPDMFPDVALYLKSGSNFVLYKSHGRDFSGKDSERLKASGCEFLYVSPGDMEVITEYMENNAERFLKSDKLNNKLKGKMMYQTSVNFVGDIFSNPEKVTDFERSKRLMKNLLDYISSDSAALTSLESVMSHNYPTFVHSLQVATLSLLIHSEAHLIARDEMLDVGMGSLLHDFGKIFVPRDVLKKNSKLTESEIETIRRHPEEGYQYLKEKTQLSEVSLSIVRYHHERINGNGYPFGLKGSEISRSAQICGICDVYCNLAVDRSGRKALPPGMIIHVMKQEMKGAFNERLLDILETITCVENHAQLIF
jgi:HD-GYP domain-containing protein (c-di-GMP phosphodiesterase class II)